MKRSKNHNKLCNGDKPHIYIDCDFEGFYWKYETKLDLDYSLEFIDIASEARNYVARK